MSHILIVEDDRDIADLLQRYLTRAGHVTDALGDGGEALAFVRSSVPDLVILGLMLPGVDGLEVCRTLRREPATRALPIIMLTVRTEESDRIAGLELGADDYVTKPFSPREVVARVKAVLRRANRSSTPSERMSVGDLTVDPERREVLVGDTSVELTRTEFDILSTMVAHPGRVYTRLQLMEASSDDAFEGYERTIDAHMPAGAASHGGRARQVRGARLVGLGGGGDPAAGRRPLAGPARVRYAPHRTRDPSRSTSREAEGPAL